MLTKGNPFHRQRDRTMADRDEERAISCNNEGREAGDWSLRANGEVYFDRSNETEALQRRIVRSSASVTGIAGQRGAGKSSLAIRALNRSGDRGEFTLLIHSPTGYEPQDFLVSIFQRSCEEVISRINQKFGIEEGLYERGKREAARASAVIQGAVLGVLVVASALVAYSLFLYIESQSQAKTAAIQQEIARIDEMVSRTQRTSDQIAQQLLEERPRENDDLRSRQAELARELEQHREDQRYLQQMLAEPRLISFELVTIGISSLILYVCFWLSLRWIARMRRHNSVARMFPRERGLKAIAEERLEQLRFQTTLQSGSEAGVGVSKLKLSMSRQRSLEARPFSLPGLTAEWGKFLEQVAEVFGGKVIICLDELDKIENSEELEALLRAIKGVLGHRRTHFILTVSEDALATFSARRFDRGMVESSFEEVIYLGRIRLEIVKHILEAMAPGRSAEMDLSVQFQIWLFANGIPREIKRNTLICLERLDGTNGLEACAVWQILMKDRVGALRHWAIRVGGEGELFRDFLELLQVSEEIASTRKFDEFSRFQDVITRWFELQARVNSIIDNIQEAKPTSEREILRMRAFGRAGLDIIVGFLGIYLIGLGNCVDSKEQKRFLEIFDLMPSNLRFASELLSDVAERCFGSAVIKVRSVDHRSLSP